ncbi:MAG: hypothetical protein IPK77_00085 [Cellvibrio sp.]|jgi:hypothetical protein|nr:hypothetical protein [Cellvibrio sp.]
MKSVSKTLFTIIAITGAAELYAATPEIDIEYSPTFDSICSLVKGGNIKDEWKKELVQRQPELEVLWESIGPTLIASVEEITGNTFPDDEQTVRLTLCELPSQSFFGISVNMRYALSSFTDAPVPLRYKADTIFHELLHKFIAEHHLKDSHLLKAHSNEPERTRDHLHLLALQKAVLLKLNAIDELADVIRIDSQLPGGYYKRAWEIINATDTEYLKYVAEFSRN